MKILHISTDDYTGGASIAAYRLHFYLLQESVNSSMLVLKKSTSDKLNIIQFKTSLKYRILARIISFIEKRKIKIYKEEQGLFSVPKLGNNVEKHRSLVDADVIVLHWINRDFLKIRNIEAILKYGKPVYWVLHDMWAMTGGCHYSFECEKYKIHCTKCPHLINPSRKDVSFQLFKKKTKSLATYNNLEIITPSHWLGNCAANSKIFSGKIVHIIPNILNTLDYKPIDKKVARKIYNLPENKTLLLFGAITGTDNPYKGWSYLLKSLQVLSASQNNILVVIMGSGYNQEVKERIPYPVYFTGHLKDTQSICMLYNAVDLFILPSLADNLPNTIVESLACNTPVVAFNTGGIPDLIEHKINGYIAKYKDSEDLAIGIEWVIENKKSLQSNARKKVEVMMEYSKQELAKLFIKL